MKAPSLASRILIVLAATVLLLLSATLAWGVALDYQTRGLVPNGVSVAGRDMSGLTEDQARAAVVEAVSTPMLRPVTVTHKDKTWTLDPKDIVSVDVDSMLSAAYLPRRTATLVQRLTSEVTGEQTATEIKPAYSVDSTAVADWVAATAKEIDRKPVDATRTIKGYKFKIKPSVNGAKVSQRTAVKRIVETLSAENALSASERSVSLPVKTAKAKITAKNFKTGIIVSLAHCKIYLYKGEKLVKTYMCAPGRPQFPTPTGDFTIVRKLANAPWINPGSDWAKSMPPMIPAGPSNPMGIRKIGIDYPGVFFHGIPAGEYSSIGTHASHGCMRMMPSAVMDLFGRVKVGDKVFIRNY
jgi:lipoprotein-anchoring transpeptidase ErfK/SrfK